MKLFIYIYFILFQHRIGANKFYKSRKELNETIYGKTRYAVDNFIDNHHITLLERLLKKRKFLFQDFGNNFKLPNMNSLFEEAFISGAEQEWEHNCTWGPDCIPMADQAITVLKRYPNKLYKNEYLEEIESFVYIRDKIYQYVSEIFNTNATLTQYGGYFYFFPKHPPIEITVNGTGYIFAPHNDLCPFQSNTFDRPLAIGGGIPHNPYRRFTAVLYFDDPPPNSGGLFRFIDLPNLHNTSYPHSKGVRIRKPGVRSDFITGGAFSDPDAIITTIKPGRGKLTVLGAKDLHGVTSYTGNKERWGVVFFMTDSEGHVNEINGYNDPNAAEEVLRRRRLRDDTTYKYRYYL